MQDIGQEILTALDAAQQGMAWYDKTTQTLIPNARARAWTLQEERFRNLPRRVAGQGWVLARQIEMERGALYIEQQSISYEEAVTLLKELGAKGREIRLLWHLYEGRDNNEIAEVLGVKVGTVKSGLYQAYNRIGVRSRSNAVRKMMDLFYGLLEGEDGLA